MAKEAKTNAMRMLDRQKVKYEAFHSYPENLQFPTLNVPIIANFSPATKKVPTVGSNANLFSSRWTKKAVQRKRLPHRYWYRLPTCAMQLRNWTKA